MKLKRLAEGSTAFCARVAARRPESVRAPSTRPWVSNERQNISGVLVFSVSQHPWGRLPSPEDLAQARRVIKKIDTIKWRKPSPSEREMLQTSVLALPLEEAVAKARTGPPLDPEEDVTAGIWAGVIPLVTRPGNAISDRHVQAETPVVDASGWGRFRTN